MVNGFPSGRQEGLCRCLPLPIIFEYPTVRKPCKALEHTLTFSKRLNCLEISLAILTIWTVDSRLKQPTRPVSLGHIGDGAPGALTG